MIKGVVFWDFMVWCCVLGCMVVVCEVSVQLTV